ncbi:FecR domain-containing protein [Luteimonas sp. RD2P54]|uniref:FecR domain-containing protein n=1 Tax=Luteimonas endophytica TaxID=3042023 RepID=A0ABT6J625_9GAMM|nr:FecR domain-containing protein [Luteimonas endophytica]MDH5822280.1 FecR domain-containing protein [Luteimonas endophytica]
MSAGNDSAEIDGIAAAWAVRAAEGTLGERDRGELEAWLARDARHRGAYVRAQAIWLDLDRVAAMAKGGGEAPPAPRPRARMRTFAVAASVLVAVLAGAGIGYEHWSGRHAAGVGEIVRLALDDGSIVVLNTDSVIRVRYGAAQRRIHLQRGEATFQVVRDPARPFVVEAGDVAARAVGTEFAVRRLGDAVAVTVLEGVVEVERPGARGLERPRRAVRNDQVVSAPARPMVEKALSAEEVSRRHSWREGYLTFDGEPLEAAIAEMNRYSEVPIRIVGADLAAEHFVGVFRIGDTRAFARSAAATFDARVEERSDALVLTRGLPGDPPPQRQ